MYRSGRSRYETCMKLQLSSILMKLLTTVLTFLMMAWNVPAAYAESCDSVAARLAASKGGSVLSVNSRGSKCTIRLLIPSGNGPPKRQTFVVDK